MWARRNVNHLRTNIASHFEGFPSHKSLLNNMALHMSPQPKVLLRTIARIKRAVKAKGSLYAGRWKYENIHGKKKNCERK